MTKIRKKNAFWKMFYSHKTKKVHNASILWFLPRLVLNKIAAIYFQQPSEIIWEKIFASHKVYKTIFKVFKNSPFYTERDCLQITAFNTVADLSRRDHPEIQRKPQNPKTWSARKSENSRSGMTFMKWLLQAAPTL